MDPTELIRQTGTARRRVEDDRLITGRGQFIDDLVRTSMLHASFLRSPHAHAHIRSVDVSAAMQSEGVVAVYDGRAMASLCKPVRATIKAAGLIATDWPVIAIDRVRFSGEAVAVVIATTRALADAALEFIEVDYDSIPVVIDAMEALTSTASLLHPEAGTNVLYRHHVSSSELREIFAAADLIVHERFSTQRATGVPIEPRGYLAEHDERTDKLTLWSSTQVPHIVRTGLSEILDLDENRIRVIAPDVGGAFGVKGQLFPEEGVVCALARILRRPIKWIEYRQEHMLASIHSREHRYDIKAAVRKDGKVLGLQAKITVDAGAYSVYPYTISTEPLHASILLPGPYDIQAYECEALGVATNKCPIAPYRGVSRPPANFATERLMDIIARRLGMDPAEIRMRNLIDDSQFPYRSVSGFTYDSGRYKAALRQALDVSGYDTFRAEQAGAVDRAIGVGLSFFIESTAGGAASFAGRGMPVAGFDMATVTVGPTAKVEIFTSAASQGQSHETVFAQIAADELHLPIADIVIRGGDSQGVPFGTGTFGSRSAVMSGGAIILASRKVRDDALKIAAHLLEAPESSVVLDARGFHVAGSNSTFLDWAEVAQAAHYRTHLLPADCPRTLSGTATHDLPPGQNPCSYGVHVAFVEVDPETGELSILKYVVLEDCGPMLNPMVVEGQIHGALAQGIGTALMEALIYNQDGQLLAASLMDYALPRAADVPQIILEHMNTPSPFTLNGAKGMAEGASVAPGPTLANAVCDALRSSRVEFNSLPLTSERIWKALQARAVESVEP